MNQRVSLLIFSTLISLFAMSGCGPVTLVPDATSTPKMESVVPVVNVQTDQVGPYIVGQTPAEGQRLELSGTIQFLFDREMDQAKTAEAFTFLNSDQEAVLGKITWPGPKTFSFKPDSKLSPSSIYQAVFATEALGLDGKALQDEIKVEFTTSDSLLVGQVFPIDHSEDVDGKTNLTVIFNHPVVPLKIKEEQTNLPSP